MTLSIHDIELHEWLLSLINNMADNHIEDDIAETTYYSIDHM